MKQSEVEYHCFNLNCSDYWLVNHPFISPLTIYTAFVKCMLLPSLSHCPIGDVNLFLFFFVLYFSFLSFTWGQFDSGFHPSTALWTSNIHMCLCVYFPHRYFNVLHGTWLPFLSPFLLPSLSSIVFLFSSLVLCFLSHSHFISIQKFLILSESYLLF